jgi:CDP-paratose 2-epimerase
MSGRRPVDIAARPGPELTPQAVSPLARTGSYALITGGAGFLGANLADRLASAGERVLILDNLARANVGRNLAWLQQRHGDRITVRIGDVRDGEAVRQATRGASVVFHLAAQVAVTSSIEDPVADFEVNARGTLNVLEALRRRPDPPPLLFASTNKVYGKLFAAEQLRQGARRYEPGTATPRAVDESCPLELFSPYGCSKGAADQYVLDYARVYGLPTVVFRMSCLYGPRQFGTEDQGWVAHFLISALSGRPITIYGDGRQVRDLLFVDDAIEAYLLARERIDEVAGCAFNLGGGVDNACSLLELIDCFPRLGIAPPPVAFAPWRPGDQIYYVSDTAGFERLTGWRARTSVVDGLARLHRWLVAGGLAQPERVAQKVSA